ncbi:hypothetical protein L6164_006425 [Bauhinia variegata]|uniref:Uncharacterized protein n=1 Tax=Bauhinia variegata TaxID=167791 RepID=A0ACB9PZT9_BAUVA|nr:hypothetical protein L6164_006425 [Bauhinia variegata]
MGNYISCTLSTQGSKPSKAIRVIFPTGEIRQLQEAVKAAELMLDMPNFFVVNTRSLRTGQRFSALNADEELELGRVYVLFPMKRLNSVVTADDMGALLITINASGKRVSKGKVRILPENDVEEKMRENWQENMAAQIESKPRLNLDDIEDFSISEFMHRLSMHRSKKPLLETIVEEPVCSR